MNTRAAHVDDDLLSAYLDGELPEAKAEHVEDHLAACTGCRARLDGLERVVRSLARLERAAPPPVLAQRVQRRIAVAGREASFVERLEGRLQGIPLDSPLVVMFAVVLALGVIVYLFAHQVAHHRGDVSLTVTAPEAAEGLMGEIEAVEIDGRELVRHGEVWVEVDLPATRLEESGGGDQASGRLGDRGRAGEGAAEAAAVPGAADPAAAEETAARSVPWGSDEAAALRAEHPWIEELLTLTGASAVEFRDPGGEVLRLDRRADVDPPAAEPVNDSEPARRPAPDPG